MKKKLLLSLVASLFILPAFAKDFSFTANGKSLTYTILDESAKTCEVAAFNSVSDFINIPEVANGYKVTAIGNNAFFGCIDLKNVYLPASITLIGSKAFYDCDGLELISCDALTPPRCESDIVSKFEGVTINIYPKALDKYKKADVWKNFSKFDPTENRVKLTLISIRTDI